MRRLVELALASLTLLASTTAVADAASALRVESPYVRETAPGQKNGAAFFVLHNGEASAHRLVRVEASAAERVQLHRHMQHDGTLSMALVPEVEVPGRGTVVFAPGGLHVMLLGLRVPLRAGETVLLELHFDDGSSVSVRAPVRRPT